MSLIKRSTGNGMITDRERFIEQIAPNQFDKLDLHVLDELSHEKMFYTWLETKHGLEAYDNWLEGEQEENYERNFIHD